MTNYRGVRNSKNFDLFFIKAIKCIYCFAFEDSSEIILVISLSIQIVGLQEDSCCCECSKIIEFSNEPKFEYFFTETRTDLIETERKPNTLVCQFFL